MNKAIIRHFEQKFSNRAGSTDREAFLSGLVLFLGIVFIITMLTYGHLARKDGFLGLIVIAYLKVLLGFAAFNFLPFIWSREVNFTGKLHSFLDEIFSFFLFPMYSTFRRLAFNVLHKTLPGRDERNSEIRAFVRSVVEQEKEKEVKNERIVKSFKENTDLFLETYFQNTQSFKRFFLERVYEDGAVNEGKLLFLMLVPRIKTMPIDSLREVVMAANFEAEEFYGDEVNDMKELVDKKEQIEALFKDFSIAEIKSIFTRTYHPNDYLNLLQDTFFANLENEPFIPANKMKDLIDYAPVTKKMNEIKLSHPYLKKLPDLLPEYRVKILYSKDDYIVTGRSFSNCVSAYYRKSSNIFTLSDATGSPVACVEISDHKVKEMSGFRNASLSRDVKSKITTALKKARSMT